MNKRKLAAKAIEYLAVLGSNAEYPPDSNKAFYKKLDANYGALLTLNNAGLGATNEELQAMVDAPLNPSEIAAIVKRLVKLDALISAEYKKEDDLNADPTKWKNFFSGYKSEPTGRCSQLLKGIEARVKRYSQEQSELFKSITMEQAERQGYCVGGMDIEDFKSCKNVAA
ncbi:hypothetical protein [Pseudoalteromonas prydzensis]|uniref:hypothetical protein n=1 Tax=Pseudoalteromonas prydzensis TaxID=182141 RepID=UPI003FD30F93